MGCEFSFQLLRFENRVAHLPGSAYQAQRPLRCITTYSSDLFPDLKDRTLHLPERIRTPRQGHSKGLLNVRQLELARTHLDAGQCIADPRFVAVLPLLRG